MSHKLGVKDAATTVAEMQSTPLCAIIDNSVEQLLAEHGELDGELDIIGLVQAAVLLGVEIANTRLGDLF